MGKEIAVDVLIVGAGFAGAATAFHLSRRFAGRIALVEREKTPGAHASGRNASLFRQSVADPQIRRVAVASGEAYRGLRREIDFGEVGSLVLAERDRLERLRDPAVAAEVVEAGEVRRRVPLLEGHRFRRALWTPGDGVIDTWALLSHYLAEARSRGVELATDCEVLEIAGPAPFRVTTSRGCFRAARVVDAAGAWAPRIARLAGLDAPYLVPFKRHLFVLDGIEAIDPGWPFVWSEEHDFYFRPESGGLLFSVCDGEPAERLVASVSEGISEVLAERILEHLPALEEARVRNVWSCFRTKTPDDRFLIGPDPRCEGFFWVAGLGGHGMSCSWEIGRLAARTLRGEQPVTDFDPARFTVAPLLA
ncbi:MAG: FAD-binding oxidoreductase [bacterium]|nr:FAD-binding oxidoreductase [bacterium]